MVTRDVTEQQRVLEALRESEQPLPDARARRARRASSASTTRGGTLYLNERWSELTGIPDRQALANPARAPAPSRGRRQDPRGLAARARRGTPAAASSSGIVRPDGRDPLGAHAGACPSPTPTARSRAGSARSPTCPRSAPPSRRWPRARSGCASRSRARDMCTWEWDAEAETVQWSANAARVFGLPRGRGDARRLDAEATQLRPPRRLRVRRRRSPRDSSRAASRSSSSSGSAPRAGEETRWVLMRGHRAPAEPAGRAIGVRGRRDGAPPARPGARGARGAAARVTAPRESRPARRRRRARLQQPAGRHPRERRARRCERPISDPGCASVSRRSSAPGERAAGLVRQMLAFAGRERIARERIDLREIVRRHARRAAPLAAGSARRSTGSPPQSRSASTATRRSCARC